MQSCFKAYNSLTCRPVILSDVKPTIITPRKFVPNVVGHISVYLKWQVFESKIMWNIVFLWTIIFPKARSSHSKSKLIHGCIQQWCHSNKIPKRLDQSFGYRTCWNPNPIHRFRTLQLVLTFHVSRSETNLFVEIFLIMTLFL